MKILITSGGTKVPIDSVRDITNMSTGTFGTKLAEELLSRYHTVSFFRAKGSKSPMRMTLDYTHQDTRLFGPRELAVWLAQRSLWKDRYREMVYSTFEQYERGLNLFIGGEKPDVIVLAAAVSDYGVEMPFKGKVRSNDLLTFRLDSLPKVINKVKGWAPTAKLVGFKLLVGATRSDLILAAKKSCEENGCDMVVANDLEHLRAGAHRLILVFPKAESVIYDTDPKDPDYLAKMVASHIEKL
jgi:phosphopantothenoylcysteine synthetase/decarboxylase